MTLDGHLIYVNEAACQDRGYKKDELLRKNVSMLAAPEYAEKREEILKNLLVTGELIFESAHLRQDGSKLPVEIHARLIDLDDLRLILSVARDITKRKQAEEAVQRERGQAQRYLDVAGVMIAVLNNYGRIILMNKKGCEILGYQEEEIVGRDWFEVCPPGVLGEDCQTAFDRLIAGDLENAKYCEHSVLTKDGRKRLIAFHNTILRDQNSQIPRHPLFPAKTLPNAGRKSKPANGPRKPCALPPISGAPPSTPSETRSACWTRTAEFCNATRP